MPRFAIIRSPLTLLAATAALSFAAGSGCSSKNTTEGGEDGGATPAGNFEVGPAGSCGATRPTNDSACQPCTPKQTCDLVAHHPYDDCCVLMNAPVTGSTNPVLARTGDTREYSGTGAPDVSCFDPGKAPKGGTPGTATIKGLVKIFSAGCASKNVAIEVWTVKRGGADDGMPDHLVGQRVVTQPDGEYVEDPAETNCGDPRQDFKFEYPDVPTYTELMVKTFGAPGTDGEQAWAELYDYNQYIDETDSAFDSASRVYNYDVRALSASDFQTIPAAAMGRTIAAGNGAVAGEIHDCGNIRLQNAVADVDKTRTALTYFSDNEDTPLPDNSRSVTSRLGLYAALDVAPGPARLAAMGLVEDASAKQSKLVTLGWYDVQVFPNAVTAVSLKGLRPYQVK